MENDEDQSEEFWVCIVCGWEGHSDKVGRFCPCGVRDLDKEEEDDAR